MAAIQYLAGMGVIEIPPAEPTGDGGSIPAFVRNNAGLWADGTIDDGTFVAGLQYLVRLGIMVLP